MSITILLLGLSLGSLSHALPDTSLTKHPVNIDCQAFVDTLKSAQDALTSFYLNPCPGIVMPAIEELAQQDLLTRPNAIPPIIALLSQVFASFPHELNAWSESWRNLEIEEQQVLWRALWQSDTEDGRRLLQEAQGMYPDLAKLLSDLVATRPQLIEEMEFENFSVLDMNWGAFYGSGDPRFVKRIIGTLAWTGSKDPLQKGLAEGAMWSLESNAGQHRKVFEICLEETRKQQGVIGGFLAIVVFKAQGNWIDE